MIGKQLELISKIENVWYGNLNETHAVELSKEWVKHLSSLNDELSILLKDHLHEEKDGFFALK